MALLVEGRRRAADTAHAERAWLAYHTAALGRVKRMPTLKELTAKPKREQRRAASTADHMLTVARMWSAVAGSPTQRNEE